MIDNIYAYTETERMTQIMQIDDEALDLLKETYHIFNHTYSEQQQGNALFVFLTPKPITDEERQQLITKLTPELPLLTLGSRIQLSGGDQLFTSIIG